MGSSTRNKTIYFLLFSVVLCGKLCGSNRTEAGFKVFRSERDIFTNLNCTDSPCTNSTQRCEIYNAECVNSTCEYCRCLEGTSTLINIEDGERKCKRDEEIVPESVPQKAFSLKNDQFDQCLKSNDGSKYLTGVYCNKSPTSDMLWIWSNIEEDKQLINVKTLKCMERKGNNEAATMEQCENTCTSQKILCTSKEDSKMNIGWEINKEFLHFGKWKKKNYAISLRLKRWWCLWWCQKPQPWSSKNACKTSKVYKGCYRFLDGSFMKYLDYSQTTLTFSAPIFKEHDGKCKVKEIFKFIGDDQEWKGNGSDHFYINSRSEDTKVLKIKSIENVKAWNGSLLILNISCRNEESEEVHCILLKLKSLPPYPGVFPTSNQIATHNYRSTREVPFTSPWINSTPPITTLSRDSKFTKDQKTPSKRPSQSPTPTTYTTENPQEGFDEETSKSRGTNSTVFAITIPVTVTLLLVALVLTLLYNRKRKRSVPSRNTGNPVTDELAEFTNPRQTENNSQSTANDHESQFYANDRTFALHPLSPEYEIPQWPTYDYPEIPQNHQYEYPSLGQPILKELAIQQETNTTGIYADAVGMDSGYTSLIRRPVNNDGDNGYTHLIDIQRKEKAGATEGSGKPDELPNAQLKNKCEDSSNINAHLINENKEKDETGELPFAVVINSQYTALARPPLKNGASEDPGYEPLTNNRK